ADEVLGGGLRLVGAGGGYDLFRGRRILRGEQVEEGRARFVVERLVDVERVLSERAARVFPALAQERVAQDAQPAQAFLGRFAAPQDLPEKRKCPEPGCLARHLRLQSPAVVTCDSNKVRPACYAQVA